MAWEIQIRSMNRYVDLVIVSHWERLLKSRTYASGRPVVDEDDHHSRYSRRNGCSSGRLLMISISWEGIHCHDDGRLGYSFAGSPRHNRCCRPFHVA